MNIDSMIGLRQGFVLRDRGLVVGTLMRRSLGMLYVAPDCLPGTNIPAGKGTLTEDDNILFAVLL